MLPQASFQSCSPQTLTSAQRRQKPLHGRQTMKLPEVKKDIARYDGYSLAGRPKSCPVWVQQVLSTTRDSESVLNLYAPQVVNGGIQRGDFFITVLKRLATCARLTAS